MNNRKYLHVYMFVVFIFAITTKSTENKTSSECWACSRPITPHVLTCTGGGVIVIQAAYYGHKTNCKSGINSGGCSELERNRCCKPGGAGVDCFEPFNIRDREELNTTCSGKSTCIFNSTRHDQNISCNGVKFTSNSFTRINYKCQTQGTITVQPVNVISSSTKKPKYTTTYYDTSETSPSSEDNTSSDGVRKVTSSDGKTTSGDIAGIVLGVIAIVILLCIAAFLLYQRYENVKLVNNRQSGLNHQHPRTRTVGVQYSETDFTYINATPDIHVPVSSSDTKANYSKLETLATEPVQYDQIIMNKTQKANTKNNASGYYNQQYVNM